MDDLLGSVMGGSGSDEEGGGGDALGDLMSGLMGDQGSSGIGGMLDGLMGGGIGGGSPFDAFLAPITESIAKKLGLPQEQVQAVVSFLIAKLMDSQRGGEMRADGMDSSGRESLGLDDLMAQVSRTGGIDANNLASTDLAQEAAEATGMDAQDAERVLQEVMGALGGGGQ